MDETHNSFCEVFPPLTAETEVSTHRLTENDRVGIDIGR